MPAGGVLCGVDPGTKQIGLAFCDAEWRTAGPDSVIRTRKQADDLDAIAGRLDARGAVGFVVGMPMNAEGKPDRGAQRCRAFGRTLEDRFGLPLLMWDESLTSSAAEDAMRAAGIPAAKWPERIDAHAAAIMLQDALDWFARQAIGDT
ncbi:MAG: Holliday junction resolvase RuvX [Pseudomonadota bacterium]